MTERDRFEYAWREEYPLHESTIFRRSGLNPDAYVNTRVQDGWLMWQSCSAAHSAGAQEPVAVVDENDDGLFIEILYGDNGSPLKRGDALYAHPRPMTQTDTARDESPKEMLERMYREMKAMGPFEQIKRQLEAIAARERGEGEGGA